MPALLRWWLKKRHVNPFFAQAFRNSWDSSLGSDEESDTTDKAMVEYIVHAFAKSNSVLMGVNLSLDDYDDMLDHIQLYVRHTRNCVHLSLA